jgi:preprotein translocase SecE subunit
VADEPKKRRLKNPESFRERAVKESIKSEQPKRSTKLGGNVAKPFKAVGSGAKKIANLKVFKPLHRPLKFIGRIIFPRYFRDSWRELKQVTWPGWKQSYHLTFAVIVFAAVFGAVIAAVDYGLDKLFRNILLK